MTPASLTQFMDGHAARYLPRGLLCLAMQAILRTFKAMKLFGYYRSSASYRIRIILNYKNVDWDYQPVRLDLGEQHTAAFRAFNPLGFVPVLEADGVALSQSPAIAEYIEDRYPEPALLPAGRSARAAVRELQGIIGCDIHPIQNLRVLKYLRREFSVDDAGVAAWCREWIGAGFRAYESLVANRSTDGRFSYGDSMTMADVWLIPQVYNARRFELALDEFPTILSIDSHCASMPAFADAHPDRQVDAPAD